MERPDFLNSLIRYFSQKLEEYGPTPRGVDYNSPQAQSVRFMQLAKILPTDRKFTLLDYGCGYGALYDHLHDRSYSFDYVGFDIVEPMIVAAQQLHKNCRNARFTSAEPLPENSEYLIAGAIFNNKQNADPRQWTEFVAGTLMKMNSFCTHGFSFNMLTSYSEADRMRPDLYYGDPLFFFDYCKKHFARNVALLHDYELYDFTILVRKQLG